MSSPLRTLRHRTRLTAWLGLLALCAQLLAGGISNWHMVKRLAGSPSLLNICSSTGSVRSHQDPTNSSAGSASQHCPFCLAASAPLLASSHTASVAILPSQGMRSLPLSAGVLPRAPNTQHARTRAPPFFA
ncbi:MAG: DUF2946 family protein [Aquabacterium sp.]|jgi:hypothetical protein|uniref:DUF2946 family protein n=1 Tax=Aquabacterium sp. TaxID=1872578 RepID=UPI001B5D7ED7|nr:DUF2946 family protein [Aquabacterium sp.]MBP7131983.1 DUF2946 family protein [Aquabacterium sp.]MDQ5925955.1 hypothetical protein [Pseudomonadota bacterium]